MKCVVLKYDFEKLVSMQNLVTDTLKEIIHINYFKAEHLRLQIKNLENRISNASQESIVLSKSLLDNSLRIFKHEVSGRRRRKLEIFIKKKIIEVPTKNIPRRNLMTAHNLSSRVLTQEETNVLELGLNYAIPNPSFNSSLIDSLLFCERLIFRSDVDDTKKDQIRMLISREISQEAKKPATTMPWGVLSHQFSVNISCNTSRRNGLLNFHRSLFIKDTSTISTPSLNLVF